jgi:argininosuccinate lyase
MKKRTQTPSKSWQARLQSAADKLTESFVESITIDHRLWPQDVAGSVAHAEMLAKTKLITATDLRKIKAGFKSISADIQAGKFKFDPQFEDIHMVLESALIDRAGESGKKLHTARSRNDQIALDIRLWMRDMIDDQLTPLIRKLQATFVKRAQQDADLIMPSYTHLQRAQPITAGAYLLAFAEMLDRDHGRFVDLRKRVNICPLGSGALAGTTLPIDRRMVAKALGFDDITANSIDATGDRDLVIEYASCCATTMMHLSRFAEDWILYNSHEFGFIIIDDAFCTGSSMMPQKRNPDLLELIRGKTGRVFGAHTGLLTLMKGTPLAYNRDMQEDKFHLFSAHDTTAACLEIAEAIVRHSGFNEAKTLEATKGGFLDATVLAEYLVQRGVPFRTAHGIVGRLVAIAEADRVELKDLSLETMQQADKRIDKDVYRYLGADRIVNRYRSAGSAGTQSVRKQLARWTRQLKPTKRNRRKPR